jgi:hypothetical protein
MSEDEGALLRLNPLDSEHAISELDKFRQLGARFFVFTKYDDLWFGYYGAFFKWLSRFQSLRQNDFLIVDLQRPL